jgi:hypothetical protein
LISSNSGWHDGWFYLRNDGDQLPRYSARVLMAREENWTYGVVEDDKPKLEPLLNVLRRLCQRGLTAGMVAAAFHRQRVLPLTQRRLRLDEMMPEASLEGSRMSHESLPLDESPDVHGGWWGASGRRTSIESQCAPPRDSSPW